LLELGKALEEDLKLWGGLDPMASHETLLHRLSSKKSFDAPSLRDLREFFSRVAHIETLTSAARGDVLAKVRDRELLAAARLVKGALEKAHAGEHEEQAA
jgi:exonuclease VII large subunit